MIYRIPSIALKGKITFEIFHGHKSSLNHLRTMSCLCYSNRLPIGGKFEANAMTAVHMGYSSVTEGYILYNLITRSFFLLRDLL